MLALGFSKEIAQFISGPRKKGNPLREDGCVTPEEVGEDVNHVFRRSSHREEHGFWFSRSGSSASKNFWLRGPLLLDFHRMESLSNCSMAWQQFLNFYTFAVMFPTFLVYTALAVLLFRHADSFHPLFTTSFVSLVTAYALCNALVALRSFLDLISVDNHWCVIVDTVYLWAYMYIQPIALIGLLERLTATIFVDRYEKSRLWAVLLAAFLIGIVLVWYEASFMDTKYAEVVKTIQLVFSICICLCLMCLLWVNRRLTLASRARSTLTTRYQLAENVKALRIFVPFIVVDNCLSLMFVFSAAVFDVDVTFDDYQCETNRAYLPLFILFRTILNVAQLSMPILVVRQHPSMWGRFRQRWRTSISHFEPATNVIKIRNVLGMDVVGLNEDHFAQLQQQWLKKF
ncbi:unnamed protein product [Caenorhabditis auriculariae]|uniref:Uncharacterized protein n=1 Tax=Caenorhabditis auriculariae TaxID=2777116 RepID=A0A8S1HWN5_9PELO|nr:unnamed protein product [Caenorhabditis auriculariae]